MRTLDRWKSEIEEICRKAIDGSMTIEEFYRRWPIGSKGLKGSKFAQSIYEDIEDGVQHFPAKLISGKPDLKLWISSDTYRRLVIAYELVKMDLDEADLLRIRDLLLHDQELALDQLTARAAELETLARRPPESNQS